MFDRYPFILPIFLAWLILPILIILVFYTKFGLKKRPILNRIFLMRFSSILLFFVALAIILSGVLQLMGTYKVIGGKGSGYWHALIGYMFLLSSTDHIIIHLKDIYRYIFKRKPKREDHGEEEKTGSEQS